MCWYAAYLWWQHIKGVEDVEPETQSAQKRLQNDSFIYLFVADIIIFTNKTNINQNVIFKRRHTDSRKYLSVVLPVLQVGVHFSFLMTALQALPINFLIHKQSLTCVGHADETCLSLRRFRMSRARHHPITLRYEIQPYPIKSIFRTFI